MTDVLQTQYSRVFAIEGRAGPVAVPSFMGFWRAGQATWPQGDVTLVRLPSPTQYGAFITVDEIPGDQGTPEINIQARNDFSISALLRIVRLGCPIDLQIAFGDCANPQDRVQGWRKMLVLEGARPTNYQTGELGAFEPGERAVINEEAPFAGIDMYEIAPLSFGSKAAAQVAREVMGITVCDAITCGECGIASDGCQVVFAVTKSSDASPGLVAELVWTEDGGLTWDDVDITSLTATEDPNDVVCVGTRVIVVSAESISHHYAPISEIVDGDQTATWTEVTTGYVAAGGPRAIWTYAPTYTWIVGAGGYIYFTADPSQSVTVQDAGVATSQVLNDVHGLDQLNVVAVGASNAVVYTRNGGSTWVAVTGPAVGVALNAVWMVSETTWWVGSAGGRLYFTRDSGATWTERTFSGSGAGSVRDIKFVNNTVGYMAHSTAAPAGRIFRTLDGGASWYIMPEASGQSIPANDYIAKLATCTGNPNVVFGGGLGDDALDGIVVKAA